MNVIRSTGPILVRSSAQTVRKGFIMKKKVPMTKSAKPSLKVGKATSGKVKPSAKPVGKPRMRTGRTAVKKI